MGEWETRSVAMNFHDSVKGEMGNFAAEVRIRPGGTEAAV
jgi:hypothetical protein